ncbi:hypothetical protein OG898_21435 [Streptomyces sp. NBC_00193]|uniref:hypothetical protein n=1 Tax=Streptomyces sp. NBC_00193 TaxID=2975675 RepID=UPI0022596365|nr:hypothetical protein [Streptomyces sp. NBC_00193]MCX5299020.1 hypothetical protein [Streptomyces sp. NBC_00193]
MTEERIPRSRLMLALGTGGQTASTTVLYALPYLLPALQRELGLSLVGAGVLVSCPIAGVLLGLIGWGVVAGRYGERLALSAGLLGAAGAMALAAAAPGVRPLGALLVLAGAAGSSVSWASGRLVGQPGPADAAAGGAPGGTARRGGPRPAPGGRADRGPRVPAALRRGGGLHLACHRLAAARRQGHTLGRTDGSANHGLKPTRGAVAGGRPRLDCPEGNSSPAGV